MATSTSASAAATFHSLRLARVRPEAAGSVSLTFAIPPELTSHFTFEPGQYLTLRTRVGGQEVRRNYSICSTPRRLVQRGELEVGIRPVQGGVFSNWAAQSLRAGDVLDVMPPEGRFCVRKERAIHRVGFAAGSGITPILSIMEHTLDSQPRAKFTLVYGNRSMDSVMFNEALQDLKDRYKDRVTLIHILSRQAQESDLLQGRIDGDKVRAIVKALLPAASMDEVFICGPEQMIDATQQALLDVGVRADRIYTERFGSPGFDQLSAQEKEQAVRHRDAAGSVALTVVVDGKEHRGTMNPGQMLLDVALGLGLDLPYSCKAGVCSTCRCKVMEGTAAMDKNFALEDDYVAKGYVLACQARPTSNTIRISYDER